MMKRFILCLMLASLGSAVFGCTIHFYNIQGTGKRLFPVQAKILKLTVDNTNLATSILSDRQFSVTCSDVLAPKASGTVTATIGYGLSSCQLGINEILDNNDSLPTMKSVNCQNQLQFDGLTQNPMDPNHTFGLNISSTLSSGTKNQGTT